MKIVTSNSSRGVYLAMTRIIKKNLSLGGEHVIIVPDRFTVSVERGILESLSKTSTFNITVSSFTRLASKMIGNRIKRCLTPEGSVMLLAKVVNDKKDELKYYTRAVGADGFADELYAAVTALRNSGVSVADLRAAAEKLPTTLKSKALDLAEVFDGYLQALEGEHSDSSTRLEFFAEYLKNTSDILPNFYVMDFYEFKAPERDILRGLNDRAQSLTVGLVSGENYPNERIYPNRIAATLKSLVHGAETVKEDEQLSSAQDALSRWLFAYDFAPSRVDNDGKFVLHSAHSVYDEVLAVALDIKKKVMFASRRYAEFEVCAPMLDEYATQLKSVFARMDIPFFIDAKELLSEQTKVRYMLAALETVAHNCRRTDVMELVKNPLFVFALGKRGLDEDAVFAFENYVLRYNVDYSRFRQPFEIDDALLPRAESVREALVETLDKIDIKGFKKTTVFADALKRFSDDMDEGWKAHIKKLEEMSPYYVRCAEQVDSKVDEVLNEIGYVVGNESTDMEGFLAIFKAMLEKLKIALVPTYRDCVFIGDGESRYMGIGDIYVVGATQGSFPSVKSGGVVLTDKDEELFALAGIDVTPSHRQKNFTEMLSVAEILKKSCGGTWVSYAESTGSGKQRPSLVFKQLQSMIEENGEPLKIRPIDFDGLDMLEGAEREQTFAALFSSEKSCRHEVLRQAISGRTPVEKLAPYAAAYSFVADGDKVRIERTFDTPEKIDGKLVFDADMQKTNISRLERYFACPYSHYFQYALGLKRRDDAELKTSETGSIIHEVLEKFFVGIRDGKVTPDNRKEYAGNLFDNLTKDNRYSSLMATTGKRSLTKLKNECVRVCDDLGAINERSQFKPYLLEAYFGGDTLKPLSIKVGDKSIDLVGKIDRVDKFGNEVVIIDYKSYKSADVSYKSLYYGAQLQLFIYMRALATNLTLRPVGVFYLPVFAQFSGDNSQRYKLKGLVINEDEVCNAIDARYAEDQDASTLPVAPKNEKTTSKTHVDQPTLDALGAYAERIAAEGVKEMSDGYIAPLPLDGDEQCKKCQYACICTHLGKEERKTDNVTVDSFQAKEGENE